MKQASCRMVPFFFCQENDFKIFGLACLHRDCAFFRGATRWPEWSRLKLSQNMSDKHEKPGKGKIKLWKTKNEHNPATTLVLHALVVPSTQSTSGTENIQSTQNSTLSLMPRRYLLYRTSWRSLKTKLSWVEPCGKSSVLSPWYWARC